MRSLLRNKRTGRSAAATVAVVGLIGGGTLMAGVRGASAQPAIPVADATVTVVHGIPNTPVDVYVNGTDVLPDFKFKTVSSPLSLSPGTYAVAIRPAGASPSSTPILQGNETLTSGENATIEANLTASGTPTLNVFANPTTATPSEDATVIVRHTADAPAVDVYAGSTKIISSLTNPNQASLNVLAGPIRVSVTAAGGHTAVIGPEPLYLSPGHVYIVYAVGSLSAGTLTALVQTYSVGADATVTVVHGIPNTPVDVYVNGTDVLPDFKFKTLSSPLSLAPGSYTVALRAAGASVSTTPILQATETLTSDENATIVANLSATGTPTLNAFANPVGITPAGDATVIVRHTAEAPAVDVYAGTTRIISSLANPGSSTLNVPAGTVSVSVTAAGGHTPVIGPLPLTLSAGNVYIVYAVGSLGAGSLTAVLQNYTVGEASGYFVAGRDGSVYGFGYASTYGSASSAHLAAPVVGIASTPDGLGYWLVAADGGVFNYGDAKFYGSASSYHLDAPIVGIATTPDGKGYWLVASDGGVFSYGDASFYGSTGGIKLAQPVVGISAGPGGKGYWLVASDGGVFSYGTAKFHGSTGGVKLAEPVVGIAVAPAGTGYWLVASDGGVFNFGTKFYGSAGSDHLDAPVTGAAVTPDGQGYWLIGTDGGVFSYGDAAVFGSVPGLGLAVNDIAGISAF